MEKNSHTPEGAEKVFEGVIFDVYQWQQKMYDGSYSTFEKLRRPDTVVIVAVTPEKKIIMLEQEQPHCAPFLGLPGGRVDDGETVEEAAKRELLEEAGMTSENWDLWYSYRPLSKIDWSVNIFIAKDCIQAKEPTPDKGEKFLSKKEVEFEEYFDWATDEEAISPEVAVKLLKAKMENKVDEVRQTFIG